MLGNYDVTLEFDQTVASHGFEAWRDLNRFQMWRNRKSQESGSITHIFLFHCRSASTKFLHADVSSLGEARDRTDQTWKSPGESYHRVNGPTWLRALSYS